MEKSQRTSVRSLLNVTRPSIFAYWGSLKLGFFLLRETKRKDIIFLDDYISKGWLLSLGERHSWVVEDLPLRW
jgi:hypothetical protein